ncbi:hypothetical protein LTR28_009397, partial [Elasticomyces elasticus]
MTKLVHIPHTVHPNAASASKSTTLLPQYAFASPSIAIGDTAVSTTALTTNNGAPSDGGNDASSLLGKGRMKERGDAQRPTRRESEKLRVARVEREAPRSRREKECSR